MNRGAGDEVSAAALEALGVGERQQRYATARAAGADTAALARLRLDELEAAAATAGIAAAAVADAGALRAALLHHRARAHGFFWASGVLELGADGFGFLRSAAADFRAGAEDVYVSGNQILHLGLRSGHFVEGPARCPRADEHLAALLRVEAVGGRPVGDHLRRAPFEARAAVMPHTELALELAAAPLAVRAIARLAPVARGARVLVAFDDPGVQRTRLLGAVAAAAAAADPDLVVHACLLDAAPEDRAAFAPWLGDGAVVADFDAPPTRQVDLAELCLARAQRVAEAGKHVLLVLDSLSALARVGREALPRGDHRAHDGAHPAVQRVKRAFALARQLEGSGSLTLLASVRAPGERDLGDDLAALLLRKAGTAIVFADDGSALPDPLATATHPHDLVLGADAALSLAALRARLAAVAPADRAREWPRLLD